MAMEPGAILAVEGHPREAAMTVRALKKHNVPNNVLLAHDGAEALDYLYGSGAYAGRDPMWCCWTRSIQRWTG